MEVDGRRGAPEIPKLRFRKNMKLLDRMRQQKLLSTTLMLFTLSLGIVIGTLVNTGVNAARAQNAAPDATPLVLPAAVETGNEFSKLAKRISPSVVNITADYMPKRQTTRNRVRPGNPDDQEGAGTDEARASYSASSSVARPPA
jgi:hypothetical protein